MKINIVCIGKIKEKPLISLISEFQKRCSKYCSLKIKELPDKDFAKDIEKTKIVEGEAIINACDSRLPNLILDLNSSSINSIEFANIINNYKNNNSGVNIIIGGSYGLSEKVLKSGKNLSFSKLTFPHQLFRLFVVEQIYRAFRIINNEPYHK